MIKVKYLHIFIIILFYFITINLYSSKLSIEPEKPINRQNITFIYYPDSDIELDSVTIVLYQFTEKLIEPKVIELSLFRHNNSFKNSYKLEENVAFSLIKIKLGELDDSNSQEFWDFIVNTENNTPLLNANFFRAYSYLGSLPENCQRLANFNKAIEFFDEELKHYPKNNLAYLSNLLLKRDLNLISENEFKSLINALYNKDIPNLDESEVILFARALRLIQESQKADKIERNYVKIYPKSKLAQELEIKRLSRIKNFKEFIRDALLFLEDYPNSHLNEKVWIAILQSYQQNNNLITIKDRILQINNIPYIIYSRLAFNLVKSDKNLSDSEKVEEVNKLMETAFDRLNYEIVNNKPPYFSNIEWIKISNINLSKLYQEWGDLYLLLDKPEESFEKYKEALYLLKSDYPVSLSESFLINAIKLQEDSLVMMIANQSILDSKSTGFIDSIYIELESRNNSKSTAEKRLDSLRQIAESVRRSKLKLNLLNLQYDSIKLQSSDNTIFNLSNYRNNIVILILWSKWCEPCLDLLRFIEKYNKTQMINKKVLPFVLNSLDTDQKSNSSFLKQNGINLSHYLDLSNDISFSLGLNGLPATVFIDKSGKIRFIERGFLDKDNYEQILNDLIKILE